MGGGLPKNSFQDMGNFQRGVSLSAAVVEITFNQRFNSLATSRTPPMLSPSAQNISSVINAMFIRSLPENFKIVDCVLLHQLNSNYKNIP